MLVLSWKKIRYAVVGMFTMFMIIAISLNSKSGIKQYVDTVSLPVSDKVVVIDAGHGKPDERSRSRRWNNRSTNKLKNCIKITKSIRTKWMHSNSYSF